MTAADPDLSRLVAANLDWWRLAGVDLEFSDNATAWLDDDAAGEPGTAATAPAPEETSQAGRPAALSRSAPSELEKPAPPPDLLGDSPPQTLEAFQDWWCKAPGLDAVGPRGRVPPRGAHNARLMVLVIHPEQGDGERLLSGPQGRFVDAMLAAMAIDPAHAYVASALPRYMPMADCAAEAHRGMDRVLSHHITLAAPQRIVAFGKGLAALLGEEQKKDYADSLIIDHKLSNVPVLVSEDLESFMDVAFFKGRFWRRWMEWTAKAN